MLDKVFTNNQVTIAGRVVGEFGYSHTVYGEDFYTVDIEVSRLSNSNDIIPVMVSERILDVRADYRGYVLRANGQFRSYNRHEETRNRLVLSVRFFWKATYVKCRYTGKRRWGVRSQMYCWQ